MRIARLSLVLVVAIVVAVLQAAPAREVAQAAYPGDNGKIAFMEAGQIKAMSADGTGVGPVVTGAYPSWSPDGTRIAFARGPDIFVVNEDGTGEVNVTNDPATDNGPAWSPDGTKIAFSSARGGSFQIWVTKSDGTGTPQQLTSTLQSATRPDWSPDGTQIAFFGNENFENNGFAPQGGTNTTDIYVVPAAGGAVNNITNTITEAGQGTIETNPSWSPDGSQIAFSATAEPAPFDQEIWVMNSNGSGRHTITSNAVRDSAPSWSPDGQRMAIERVNGSGQVEIYTIDKNGSGDFATGALGELPDWQPVPIPVQVEFTQAIQGLQPVSGLMSDLQGDGKPPVPIVAGKAAAMRVYFAEVDQTTEYLVEVTGQMTHSDHVTVDPGCTAVERRRNEPGCDSLDYYFTPPQGTWAAHLKVSDTSDGSVVLDETFNLTSVDTSGLIVKYLPLCVRLIAGAVPTCPGNNVATTAPDLMKKLFPTADDELFYDALAVPSIIYDAPISDDEAVLADLRQRYDLMSQGGFVADQLAGWFAPGGVGTGTLGYSDPVWGGSTGRVTWQVDTSATDALDTQFTLAHEIAHNLGLRHTHLADGCRAEDDATDWPYSDSTIQEVGFDVAAQQVMAPTKKDVMTYCSPPGTNIWISPHSYTRLLEGDFEPQSLRAASQGGGASQFIVVRGRAQADGSAGSLDSAYAIRSDVPVEPSDPLGSHCLHFSGSAESDFCFTLEFESHRTHEPLESSPFVVRVPLPAGTTRLALMRGTDELGAMELSASAPTIEITEPLTGGEWSGEEIITWSASDGDGGPLQFAVMYSPDGGDTWLPIEVDTTEAQLSLDTSVLAGEEVLLRVLASDGLNTTAETTGPVILSHGLSGDVDCSGAVNSVDALKLSRQVAGLPVAQTQPCPVIGTGDLLVFGDINCDTHITAVDTLFVLRFVAGMPVNLPQGCRPVGT